MNTLVKIDDSTSELTTTSLLIAEGAQLDHKVVIRLVRHKSEKLQRLGRLNFKSSTFNTAGGAQCREIAILTEPQATLLLAFMRNSPIVEDFKVHLVKEFYRIREALNSREVKTFDPATMPRKKILMLALEAEERAEEAEREAQFSTNVKIDLR